MQKGQHSQQHRSPTWVRRLQHSILQHLGAQIGEAEALLLPQQKQYCRGTPQDAIPKLRQLHCIWRGSYKQAGSNVSRLRILGHGALHQMGDASGAAK